MVAGGMSAREGVVRDLHGHIHTAIFKIDNQQGLYSIWNSAQCYMAIWMGREIGREWSEAKWSCSVVSNSLRPRGLQATRLLRPWDFPGKNTGVGCHFLLQEVSWPRDGTWVSHSASRCFNLWATRVENRYMYMYGWLSSLFTWNYHNIINWLDSTTKKKQCVVEAM